MKERVFTKNRYDVNNIKLNGADFAIYCQCLYSYMQNGPYQMELTELFKQASSYMENTILEKYRQPKEQRKSRLEELFDKFMICVKQNCAVQRSIKFYADKLCVSPQYLSKISKEVSGKSAGDWIDEVVLLEIKALLKYTNLTIKEVSVKMNFCDQSSFGKYFKKHVGIAPKEYAKMVAGKVK